MQPVVAVLFVSLIGLLLSLRHPDLVNYLALSRENLLRMRFHTLITYTAWPFTVEHVIRVSISLLLSTYFIGDYLAQRFMWFLVLGSAVFGALLFCIVIRPPAMLVGSVMISWGLAGAVLGLGTRNWAQLGLVRRAYLLVVALLTLGLVGSFTSMTAIQMLVAAGAFVAVRLTFTAPNKPMQPTPP